jgi:alcohol dehydrogenase class IV
VSALAVNGGSALDYLEEVGSGRTIERPPLPFIAIPTTAGSGSEATRNAVIRAPQAQVKRSIRHDLLMPRVAIVDPDLSGAAPRDVAASAGMDALTHLLEGYVSTGAQPTTDALAVAGIKLAWRALHALAAGPMDGEERERMALASLWGGIVLANAGLGAAHGLVAPLGGRCSIPHGAGCACLLPGTVRANLKALSERAPGSMALARYASVFKQLGLSDPVGALEDLRRRLGIPSLSSLGFSEAAIPGVVAASRAGSMKYNPIALTDEELSSILRVGA